MNINNLPDKDFKILVITLMESRRIMEGYNEKYNKEVENIRKFQTELTELKNTITELKNTLKDIYSKLDNAAEKATAPHSSTLAWKIPWTEEPGRLQSMGSLRVGHN